MRIMYAVDESHRETIFLLRPIIFAAVCGAFTGIQQKNLKVK